jgi:hypothetical protein
MENLYILFIPDYLQKILEKMLEVLTDVDDLLLKFLIFLGIGVIILISIAMIFLLGVILVLTILEVIGFTLNLPRKLYEKFVLFRQEDNKILFKLWKYKILLNKNKLLFVKSFKVKVKSVSNGSTLSGEKTIFSINL